MIQITLKDNAMWARGHSGYAPKGQDILCAAVSILMEATADALERQDKLVLSYFGDGFCSIIAAEDSELLAVAREGVSPAGAALWRLCEGERPSDREGTPWMRNR